MTKVRSPNLLALLSAAAKTAALLGYTLPWLTVAVGARQLISATGLDLAIGEFTVRVPILGTLERHEGPIGLPLIVAEIMMAASLGASLVAGRRLGALWGLGLSGLALCLVAGFVAYGIYVHLPLPPEQMSLIERLANSIAREVVHVNSGAGFWVTLVGLVAGMLFDGANLRGAPASDQNI